MFQRIRHVLLGTIFIVLLGAQAAWAVSFGKMDVASKMGEPFYAEVALKLSPTESISKTSVELGTQADYRILEVFRNPVLNAIRTDIVDDERGPRVTLTSDAAIDSAFFNVILKVRYGRSTHYKKFPAFLDVATSHVAAGSEQEWPKILPAEPVNSANVKPETSDAFITKQPETNVGDEKQAFEEVLPEALEAEPAVANAFQPYDGWARTAKYGPMVYGDTITTVAQRLRLDDKFTNQQVMVALFEKNKAKFSKNNINLIKAGSYLDVPSAQEVSQVSPDAAKQILSEQRKAWRAMQGDPKYAAIAEAQRNRYSSRVRMGASASGSAVAPMASPMDNTAGTSANDDVDNMNAQPINPSQKNAKVTEENIAASLALKAELMKKDADLAAMQTKVAALEERLKQENTVSTGQQAAETAEIAALDAKNKRLELVIARLKSQLDQAKSSADPVESAADWMKYAPMGLGALVLALLLALLLLLRKGRKHPAEQLAAFDAIEEGNPDATKVMNATEFEMPASQLEEEDSSEMFAADSGIDLEEIPDLTDEETGEMQPFSAEEDQPDPNMNYLEDADVYMRYGMEDEAEKQVKMALKLDDKNPEAHAKLVQVHQAKGDSEAASASKAAAMALLTGAALATFETALSAQSNDAPVEGGMDLAGLKAEDDMDPNMTADFGYMNKDSSEPMDAPSIDTDTADFGFMANDTGEPMGDPSIDADTAGFDFSDIAMNTDDDEGIESKEAETSGEVPSLDGVDSSELDSIEIDFESIEMPTMDVASFEGVGSIEESGAIVGIESTDIDALDIEADAELDTTGGTQLVSTSGDDIEQNETLNDYEIEKAKEALEAEKNAEAVELDTSVADPFAAANESLDEKVSEGLEDIDLSSIAELEGESVDPLSLVDKLDEDDADDIDLEDLPAVEQSQEIDLDVSLDTGDSIGLESLNFDLDDTSVASEDGIMEGSGIDLDVPMGTGEDVSLDDTNFDLLELESDESLATDDEETVNMFADQETQNESEEVVDIGIDEDLDGLDKGLDDLDISTTEVDPASMTYEADQSNLAANLDDVDTGSLDDLDFDLPDLADEDLEASSDDVTDDLDKTFILNDVEKNKALLESEEPKEEDSHHFSNLEDALDSTLMMTNNDDPMEDEFSATAELGNIEQTLGSLMDEDNDPMVETLGASQELDDLMKDLDGLLDEGKDKK